VAMHDAYQVHYFFLTEIIARVVTGKEKGKKVVGVLDSAGRCCRTHGRVNR
jgi:hypothetical protein